jgi:hypothetical protein
MSTLTNLISREGGLVEQQAVLCKGNELLGLGFFQSHDRDKHEASMNM